MKKELLSKTEIKSFPQFISTEYLNKGVSKRIISTHAYTAEVKTIDNKKVLVATFFNLENKDVEYRVFFWKRKNGFATENLYENKFISASLDYIFVPRTYFCMNKRTEVNICRFFGINGEPSELMIGFQKNFRRKKNIEKDKKVLDEIDQQLETIKKIPNKLIKWIKTEALAYSRYIFYSKKGKNIIGECTYCKSEVILEKVRHNASGECPSCKKKITFKAKGFSKRVIDSGVISYIEKDKYNSLFVRVFDVHKEYENASIYPKVRFYEWQRHKIDNKLEHRVFCYKSFKQREVRWCNGYSKVWQMYSYIRPEYGEVYTGNTDRVFKGTFLEHYNIGNQLKTEEMLDVADLIVFFINKEYEKYLIQKKLYNLANSRHIKSSYITFINLNRDKLKLFEEINPYPDEIDIIKYLIDKNKKFNAEHILKLRDLGALSIKDILDVVNIGQLTNYLNQRTSVDEYKRNNDFFLYKNYIKIGKKIGYNFSKDEVLFPENIAEEHDKAVARLEMSKKIRKNNVIENMYLQLYDKYLYGDEKFLIIPPKNIDDIYREGIELKHCVKDYVDYIVEKSSIVLFLREKDNIDKPFFTVEVKHNKVSQCMGYRHKKMTEEIQLFIKKFEEYIQKKSLKIAN